MNDGGPAFARPASHDGERYYEGQTGISLRDYAAIAFAAQALNSILCNAGQPHSDSERDRIIRRSIHAADSMIWHLSNPKQ